MVLDQKVMGDMGVKYFEDMITTFEPHVVESNIPVVKRVVMREMNSKLQHLFTTEEVKQAVFQMHPQKPQGLMVCLVSFIKNIGLL